MLTLKHKKDTLVAITVASIVFFAIVYYKKQKMNRKLANIN